jgi:PAS domain S-box-containing protein
MQPPVDDLLHKTLRQIVVIVTAVAAGMALYLYVYGVSRLDAVAPALIVLFAFGGWFLLRAGRVQPSILLVISGVLLAATLASIAYGSVRFAGAMLFACAVVGAGVFSSLRATLVTVMAAIGLITALSWAEWLGLMVPRGKPVGPTTVVTFSACIAVVALMLYYSRRRNEQAMERLQAELAQRLRTERERDRSLDRFVRIFRNSPSPMLAQSARDGMILDVNPAFERCFGYSREQMLGRNDMVLWDNPMERESYLSSLAAHRSAHRVVSRSLRADGSPFDVLVSSELSDDPDDRLVITTITDVTRERQHEALLASLASGTVGETGEGLLQRLCEYMAAGLGADMAGVAERTDDGHMQTLAVHLDGEPAPNYRYELVGTPCQNTIDQPDLCVFPRDADQLFPLDRPLVDGGFKAYVGHSLLDADGQPIGLIHALWRHPVELDPPSRALLTIYASRANAELMRMRRDREIQHLNQTLDQRVRERTAELQKLNAELDAFAYSVSHDLKSPLRTIDGFTQLLQDSLQDRLDASEQENFQRIRAATQRMSKLIADLLALARVSQGELQRSSVDISALAQEILTQEQDQTPGRHLQWRIAPGLQAKADGRLARVALENLLGNAVKYTRDQPQAMIELDRLPDGPGHFVLRDNGAGFDMAHAGKLFKPFQRLHSPSSGFEGTGIGLATVRRILERHGGGICARAAPGLGATFAFSFSGTPSLPDAQPSPATWTT